MKQILLSFLLCISYMGLYAQGMFEKRYVYDTYNDKATAILSLPNGRSLVTGRVGDVNHPHIFLMELAASGEIVWSKEYTAPQKNLWAGALHAVDGGFIIAGDTRNDENSELFIIKVDEQGEVLYKRFFSSPAGWCQFSGLDVATNGEIYLAGTEAHGGWSGLALLKLSDLGNLQYAKRIQRTNIPLTEAEIRCTADSGLVLCGSAESIAGKPGAILIKFDASGEMDWSKSYQNTQFGSRGQSVAQCADGGFIVCGTTLRNLPSGDPVSYTYLLKTSAAGTVQWSKQITYGYTHDVIQTGDGGFMLMGSLSGAAATGLPYGMFLAKTDPSGTVLWNKYYGAGYIEGHSFAQTAEGGFLLAGQSGVSSGGDAYVVKTDAEGNVPCNGYDFPAENTSDTIVEDTSEMMVTLVSFAQLNSSIQRTNILFTVPASCFAGIGSNEAPLPVSVYPNPSTGIFYVDGWDQNDQLEIIDVSGRPVAGFTGIPSFDLSQYPDGIYFLRVRRNASTSVQKIVLQH